MIYRYERSFNTMPIKLSQGKFKEMQYMASTNAGKLSLHAVKSSAFADTIDPQR